MGVCVHFMKKSFSQTVSEPDFLLSTYNISTDQSKDDYHLVTAGDYVLNTLLVIVASPRLGLATYSLFASLVYLFVLLSVSRLTQKRLRLGLRNFACCLLMCLSRSLLILVLISER